MVKLDPDMFFDLQSSKIPRNPNAASAQPRSYSNPEDRYRLLVELINQNLSINEIAARMNLSAPSIYLMRTQYREKLLKDTTPGMRAMRFHKKDR
jgi:transposase